MSISTKCRVLLLCGCRLKLFQNTNYPQIIPVVESFKQDMFELANRPKKIIPDYCFPKFYIKNLQACKIFFAQIIQVWFSLVITYRLNLKNIAFQQIISGCLYECSSMYFFSHLIPVQNF